MLHQRSNFEVRRPSRLYHTLSVSAVISLVTLACDLFTLKLVRIIGRGMRNLYLPILLFLGLFVLSLWGQHLSDGPPDLVTITFYFQGRGTARDAPLRAPTLYQVSSS